MNFKISGNNYNAINPHMPGELASSSKGEMVQTMDIEGRWNGEEELEILITEIPTLHSLDGQDSLIVAFYFFLLLKKRTPILSGAAL